MDMKTKFLLRLLMGIFGFQVLFMGYGAWRCEKLNRCEEAAARIETVFNVMIATTLSLLAANKTTNRS